MSSREQAAAPNIDSESKEIAMDLARKSGMTLGEWLTKMIVEGDEADTAGNQNMASGGQTGGQNPQQQRQPQSQPQAARHEDAEDLTPQASSKGSALFDRKPGESYYWRRGEGDADSSYYGHAGRTGGEYETDLARITRALERMSNRIEAAEQRSAHAVNGLDRSLGSVLSRLEQNERDQGVANKRLDGAVEEIRTVQNQITTRLKKLEATGGDERSLEALKSLEAGLSKLASHMYESEAKAQTSIESIEKNLSKLSGHVDQQIVELGERIQTIVQNTSTSSEGYSDDVRNTLNDVTERLERAEKSTSTSIQSLKDSISELEGHVKSNGGKASGPSMEEFEARFEKLTDKMNDMVGQVRSELVQKVEEAAAKSDMGQIDQALTALKAHIEGAEERSADAIDRLADEVARIAEAMDNRVSNVEGKSAGAIETISTEVAKIADAIDAKFRTAEGKNVEAIERLGAELAQVSDRLTERLVAAERRSSVTLDQIDEEVGKISDRLSQRYERASADLAERLKASENKTAEMLEDQQARLNDRIDSKFVELDKKSADLVSPVNKSMADLAARLDAIENNSTRRGGVSVSALMSKAQDMTSGKKGTQEDTPPQVHLPIPGEDEDIDVTPAAPTSAIARDTTQTSDEPAPQSAVAPKAPTANYDDAEDLFVVEPPKMNAGKPTPEPKADRADQSLFASALDNAEMKEPGLDDLTPASDPKARIDTALETLRSSKGDDKTEAEATEPEAPAEPLPLGATAGKDFLKAARESMQIVGQEKKAKKGKADKRMAKKAPEPVATKEPAKDKSVDKNANAKATKADKTPPKTPLANTDLDADNVVSFLDTMPEPKTYAAADAVPADYPLRSTAFDDLPPLKKDNSGKAARMVVGSGLAIAAVSAAGYVAVSGGMDNALKNIGVDIPQPSTFLPNLKDMASSAIAAPAAKDAANTGSEDMAALVITNSATKPVANTGTVQTIQAPPVTPTPAAPKVMSLAEAVKTGNPVAQYELGNRMAAKGDLEKAAELMKSAAGAGLAAAQFKMATFYEGGQGVEEDMAQAFQWTQRAAQGGHRKAMHNLGLYYYYGDGTTQNYEQAAKWFQAAAEMGNADSQFNLALLYEEGFGVKANTVEALKWYTIAANAGDEPAREKTIKLAAKMTPAQVNKAKADAGIYKPKPMKAEANGNFGQQPWDMAAN